MAVLSAKIKLVDEISEKLQKIGTSGQSVTKELQNIGSAASSINDVTISVENEAEAFNGTAKVIQDYNEWHENSIAALTDYVNGVDGAEEQLKKYINSTEETADSQEELKDALKGTKEGLKDTQDGLENTQEELDKTSDKTKEYENTTEKTFESIEQLIAAAGIVSFLKSVADAYGEAVEAAQEYESGIAKVTTIADTNAKSANELKSEITALSQETAVSVNDLTEAAYSALSAGVDTANVTDFVRQSTKLAVGGFTSTATAVDVLTTALNAYKLDVSETSRVADTLITTQNLGKTTVDELASSMGRVIPSAAAYNVTIEDLSSAYAVLTANGIATAEATTNLKGMLNELADSGSTVSLTLQEQTGKSFSQLEAEGSSLGDVLNILYTSANNDATAFANLWSSQEAGTGALSIATSGTEKYNSVLNSMTTSVGTAADAYQIMTNNSAHTSQALSNAASNFSIAVGEVMLPATNKFNETLTEMLTGLTTVVQENPWVVQAVTSLAVGIGTVTVAITGYIAVTKLAKIATAAFTAVMDANPIFLVATAVAAVVAGLITFIGTQNDASESVEHLTVQSQKQKEELNELQNQIDSLNESGEGNSAEASVLQAKYDELSATYEKNKQTVEELAEAHSSLMDSYKSNREKHEEQSQKIADEEESAQNLIEKLGELGSKSKLTADEQSELGVVIDVLNQKMPSLGLTYDQVASDIDGSVTKIQQVLDKQIAQEKYDEAYSKYKDAYGQQNSLAKDVENQTAQLDDANTKYNNAVSSLEEIDTRAWNALGSGDIMYPIFGAPYDKSNAQDYVDSTKTALDEVQASYDEAVSAQEQNNQDMDDAWNEMKELASEAYGIVAEESNDASEASCAAASSVQSSIEELATAYDEAYEAALTSIQGQYNLWDEADNSISTSTDTLMSNLDSQITYWTNYADNLENLHSRNIEGLDALVASMDDGSEESAAALAALANASDTELQKIVNKNTELQDEQDRTAQNVGKLASDFDGKMDDIQKSAQSAIDGMNLSDEATTAATNTINAYINAIRSKVGEAESAASAVASAVSKHLNSGSTSVQANANGTTNSDAMFIAGERGRELVATADAYATGTTDSSDFYIAGDNGPELIVGRPGSTVFPHSETEQIIESLNRPLQVNVDAVSDNANVTTYNSNSNYSEKVITLRIEGAGSIQISGTGGLSVDEVVEILQEQIKPMLISIVADEISEEGDESYEY